MSLQLTLSMSARMKQELRLSPQLQLAIKHLQLSRMDLLEEIQRELMSNPLLEEAKVNDDFNRNDDTLHEASLREDDRQITGEMTPSLNSEKFTTQHNTGESERTGTRELGSNVESARDTAELDSRHDLGDFNSAQLSAEARLDADWDRSLDDHRSYRDLDPIRVTQEEHHSPELTYTRGSTLQDHLLEQARLSSLTPQERLIAEELIWNLDERGYLVGVSVDDIAAQLDLARDEVEVVLVMLQGFDPLGVGARDLRECLLIQAYTHNASAHLLELIEYHLGDIERNQIPHIARKLKLDLQEVNELLLELKRFEPYPGHRFAAPDVSYITPDVYVEWVEGELQVRTNQDGVPEIKLNRRYRDQLRAHLKGLSSSSRARRHSREKRSHSEDLRYISERVSAAQSFINSLQQRKKTIVLVMESIIKFQKDFFLHGPEHLKPLVLRQVAEELDLHESTISRATSHKFVHTPSGLYEFKYFFHSKIQSNDGSDDLASQAVKVKIKNLIHDENPQKPLSDQKIVTLLSESGVSIARRTVAKYREALNIPSSSKRRQHV